MMDQDISKIVELIDKKLKALTMTRQTLINEFGNGRIESYPQPGTHNEFKRGSKKATRKEIVEKLIREQGPQSRKEIKDKTGIPIGSISYVLNDKDLFVSKGEKWHLVEKDSQE